MTTSDDQMTELAFLRGDHPCACRSVCDLFADCVLLTVFCFQGVAPCWPKCALYLSAPAWPCMRLSSSRTPAELLRSFWNAMSVQHVLPDTVWMPACLPQVCLNASTLPVLPKYAWTPGTHCMSPRMRAARVCSPSSLIHAVTCACPIKLHTCARSCSPAENIGSMQACHSKLVVKRCLSTGVTELGPSGLPYPVATLAARVPDACTRISRALTKSLEVAALQQIPYCLAR